MPPPTIAEIIRNPEKYRKASAEMGDVEFQMDIARNESRDKARKKGAIL